MKLSRRKFIASTAMSVPLLYSLESLSTPLPMKENPGFQCMIFATGWGFVGSQEDFCKRIKSDGYDGMEMWYPEQEKERQALIELLQKYNLKVGFLVGGFDANPSKHLQQFQAALEGAVAFKPVYINCHSGRDFFSLKDNSKFIELTQRLHKQSNVPIYHETHRGRILYSAPVSKNYFDAFTDLRITLDISHWCNVHESLLADQPEIVQEAINRTGHIHTRVGHPEGPQVNDPRAPEWKDAVQAHFQWWDQVVAKKKLAGEVLTMLTEFGPPDYLPTVPYTRQPLANQWDINVYMLNTLRQRYS
jgi:sugar phosphate isomerase/epimerase